MIGMVGTNRWSQHGMETGYCMNYAYWGQGYGGEAFRLFLQLYWTLPGKSLPD
jgi:RimJ/RimL family protein N-acetyltransferase